MKNVNEIEEYFRKLRDTTSGVVYDDNFGVIRLTMTQQEEIVEKVEGLKRAAIVFYIKEKAVKEIKDFMELL